ncbi:MAG: sigma-70 family RNA polymerase sigma factor [Planctomycetota bacterium]
MDQTSRSEQFVRQLTEHQNRLFGYVYSLLGDHARSADVVQETNLVLWRKIDEYDPTRPFLPWAFAIARFQVMANLRDSGRDRVLLDSELAETIGAEAEQQSADVDDIRLALPGCMQRLTEANRQLIQKRYFESRSIAEVAQSTGRSVGSIKVALLRIRRQLAECLQRHLASEVR